MRQAGGRLRIHLVDEIRETEQTRCFRLDGNVQVLRVHQFAHDLMDRAVKFLQIFCGVDGAGDPVDRGLDSLGLLGVGDVARDRDHRDRLPGVVLHL